MPTNGHLDTTSCQVFANRFLQSLSETIHVNSQLHHIGPPRPKFPRQCVNHCPIANGSCSKVLLRGTTHKNDL